jgi:hypothetical protein
MALGTTVLLTGLADGTSEAVGHLATAAAP